MNRRSIYIAPSAKRGGGYPNRYVVVLKEVMAKYFYVLEADNRPCLMQGSALLGNSLRADVFLLSFVETIAFHKMAWLQQWMALLSLRIMRLRRRKIIYIFHNIRPHKGETSVSRRLTDAQLRLSDGVIAHSRAAERFARERLGVLGGNPDKVHYIPHPVHPAAPPTGVADSVDVLLWGDILPYKGVLEFLRTPGLAGSGLRVDIVGYCADPVLAGEIAAACPQGVRFENRRAPFGELSARIAASRFVLFPYLPGSISSSGVLMDTLAMGGTPVGPSVGAFADLAEEDLCLTYSSAEEMLVILRSRGGIDPGRREAFVRNNTWESFGKFIDRTVSVQG